MKPIDWKMDYGKWGSSRVQPHRISDGLRSAMDLLPIGWNNFR
ncbi:hypothetical protein [Neisseria zalophi]|nr:hypothetical protein [Neisseria zalophi]